MIVGNYTLVNPEKVDRALNGSQQADSTRVGGVGKGAYKEGNIWMRGGEVISEKDVVILESALLAEYDRLGGLIRKGGDKVVTGSFYDFKARKSLNPPMVKFEFMINGKQVVIGEEDEVPSIVRAARELQKEDEIEEEDETQKRRAYRKRK